MPKKNNEELEIEGTSDQEIIKDKPAETKADESRELSESAPTGDSVEVQADNSSDDASTINSVAETIGAAVGSLIATVADSVSSVVSGINSTSFTGEETSVVKKGDKQQHNKRAERIGIVQSDKMTNTVTVRIERQVKHPIYRKYIKRRKNFMAHDEQGAAVGDKVRIVETRPLSAKKRWRVIEIIQKAVK